MSACQGGSMYRGYNLTLELREITNHDRSMYYEAGRAMYKDNRDKIQKGLSSFLSPDGTINADKMQESWFPDVNADIFLSHSHADETDAIIWAGLFKIRFGVSTFVDSCVWGFANDLIFAIDDKWCKTFEIEGHSKKVFDYKESNRTASHVHMMLASALMKTIDKCECLFFLETPRSLNTKGIVDKTFSPWIYYELGIANTIRESVPRHRPVAKAFTKLGEDGIRKAASMPMVNYSVSRPKFKNVDKDIFASWLHKYDNFKNENPLVDPGKFVFTTLYDATGTTVLE